MARAVRKVSRPRWAGAATDTCTFRCQIVAGGPLGLVTGTMYQEIATSVLPLFPAVAQRFIVSTFVCPGSTSAEIDFRFFDMNNTAVLVPWGVAVDAQGKVTRPVPRWSISDIPKVRGSQSGRSGASLHLVWIFATMDLQYDPSVASHGYLILQSNAPPPRRPARSGSTGSRWRRSPFRSRPGRLLSGSKKLISPNKTRDIQGIIIITNGRIPAKTHPSAATTRSSSDRHADPCLVGK